MGKLLIRHSRISPNVSVSLVKDSETGIFLWRYRFAENSKANIYLRQKFIDYTHDQFGSIEKFRNYIEREIEVKKRKLENA